MLAAQTDRSILLGQSAVASGLAAQLGLQIHQGARLCFDAINAQGGIHGRQIELKLLDDGYEPERCRANTEQLIRDGAFALFGYVGTPTSLAALPLVNQARIPFFGPFTGAQALREPFNRQVFHVRASYFDETELIVRQLTALGLNRIAVFKQDDSYGQAGLDGVVRALATRSLAPAAIGSVARNSVDVDAAVRAIVPKQPDAVVQISAYKSCAAFIRLARQAGYRGNFYNVSFVGSQALADELGSEGRGVMVSQVMPQPSSRTHAVAREYQEAVRQAGGQAKPTYSGIEGFIAAKVFAEGLRRAGRALTREGFIAALESLQRFDIGGFQVSFSPSNHVGSQLVDLTMLTADGNVKK